MIDKIYIEGTKKTPSILLDPAGKIKIEGRSIPEDAEIFFKFTIEWLAEYIHLKNPVTQVDLCFEYLNSGTSKEILLILQTLRNIDPAVHKLITSWYYEQGDEDILERGEYFASILNIKINYIEID